MMYSKSVGSGAAHKRAANGETTVATAIENVNADAESDESENEDTASNKSDRESLESLAPGTRVSVMVTMPKELKLILLDKAEQKNYTLARYVREWIAAEENFELPLVTRTRAPKYATEEARLAAQKQKSKARADLMRKLLAAYKAGDIDLDALDDEDDDNDDE